MQLYSQNISSPLGDMIAVASEEGLSLLEFADRPRLKIELEQLRSYFQSDIIEGNTAIFESLMNQLNEYFGGVRRNFDILLATPGTDFQNKVWRLLLDIPYGETRTYKTQAIALGNVKAIRAVGRANGDNRISIIIPCHRVIGENGELIGYGGGMHRKQWLLEHESKHSSGGRLPF